MFTLNLTKFDKWSECLEFNLNVCVCLFVCVCLCVCVCVCVCVYSLQADIIANLFALGFTF